MLMMSYMTSDVRSNQLGEFTTAPLPYLTASLPGVGGLIKQQPGDFLVEELPLYEPSGEGEHLYLLIEKQGQTTMQVIDPLARLFNVRRNDIGYAGLKDKHAVTRQYLSIYRPGAESEDQRLLEQIDSMPFTLIRASRHRNKLRRGHLAGNRFEIRIRQCAPDAPPGAPPREPPNAPPSAPNNVLPEDGLARAGAVVESLLTHGVPNYLGEQRFGNRRNNHIIGRLLLLEQWPEALDEFLGRPQAHENPGVRQARSAYEEGDYAEALSLWPRHLRHERRMLEALNRGKDARHAIRSMDANQSRFFINSLQGAIFNQVLARRITDAGPAEASAGDVPGIDRLVDGDVASKQDSSAVFIVDVATAALENAPDGRIAAQLISPTGPMWGPKMVQATGAPGKAEAQVLSAFGLEASDVIEKRVMAGQGERRPLRIVMKSAEVSPGDDERGPYLRVDLQLSRGCFATAVLREIMKNDSPAAGDE